MKLQHLIILFLVIMLPLALIMSEYTGLQIDTLATKTKYDTALLGATFDTMAAFELNTRSSETSSVSGEEIRDLEAMISTFTNSLATSLDITGVSDDYIMSYVPAMVFTLYDGYYIYTINEVSGERELKPYVYYAKTYINGNNNTNITISYSLDNYVSIYGTCDGKDVSAAGYLIVPSRIEISDNFTYATNGNGKYVVDPGGKSWIKYNYNDDNYGQYVYIGEETIYENTPNEETRGVVTDEEEKTTDAMLYYYEAKKFTEEIYNPIVNTLGINDRRILYIDKDNDPEKETSLFLNEKINVMKDSITKNLNAAIYNYDGAVAIDYEMPQLNGEDWDKILNDVAIIAFMKNMPIGTTTYNNYVVVNSTTNKKYVSPKSIDFIAYDTGGNSKGYYHNITCDSLIQNIENGNSVIGYATVDFKRHKYSPKDENAYYYYYKHNEYADYDCEVKATKRENVATIQETLNAKGLDNDLKEKVLKTYYTSVGRIRYRLVKLSSYINMTNKEKQFSVRYHVNGGIWSDGTTANKLSTSKYGKIMVNVEEPRITGYKFVGWGITNTQLKPDIKTGDVLYLEDNQSLDLYAIYSKEYIVTYNLNGGIGGPTPPIQTKLTDVDFIISKKEPTRENKKFMGWTKEIIGPDDSPVVIDYPQGNEYIYTDNADLNLYAVWAVDWITIDYYSVGIKEISQTKTRNQEIYLKSESDIPERPGYRFKGWSTGPDNTEEYYAGQPFNDDSLAKDKIIKLYAAWEEKIYTITFNANGGTPNPPPVTKIYGSSYKITSDIEPLRENYTFKGWSTDPNASIGEYQEGDYLWVEDNINLYAIWEGDTYRVLYDANGGIGEPLQSEPKLKTEEEGIPISDIKPIKEGYEFVGWSTDKFAGVTEVEYNAGDIYTGKTTIKLYAIWKEAKYTIEYIANGEVFETDEKTYNVTRSIIGSEPTKEGYDFVGWSETEGGALDYFPNQPFNNDSLARDGVIKLYAVWQSNDETVYSIEYLANGGQGAPEAKVLAPGETTITIAGDAPIRTGYTFKGWSTDNKASEEDARFAPNKHISIDVLKENAGADNVLRLYAVWGPNALTLTVDPDGGTWNGSTAVQTLTLSAGEEREIASVTKDGLYSAWQVVEGDAEIEIEFNNNQISKQIIKMGVQNSKIKPKWTGMYYNISFSANTTDSSVSGIPETPIKAQYQKNTTLPSNVPTRTSYTFAGWASTATATSAEYQPNGTYYLNTAANVTLYAVWNANSYTLTYDLNGGTGNIPAESRQYGSTSPLSTTIPTKTGYNFLGWSTSNTATTATYKEGANYTMPAQNVTLYAVWQIKTYTITYDANGGSGAPSNQTKTHGQTLTLSTKAPTRTGYNFLGWATSETATTAEYQTGGSFTTNANTTLYAVWQVSVTDISVSPTSTWIYYQKDPDNGDTTAGTKTITATLTPSDSTATVTWSSANTGVATVNSSGKITAKGPGRTTITATAGGKSANVTITVYNAVFGANLSWDPTHTLRNSSSENTGVLKTYANTAGSKWVIQKYSGSLYKLVYYNNAKIESGSGNYVVPDKTYVDNYGAW